MKTAFLFPGQGSQKPDILSSLLAQESDAGYLSYLTEQILQKSISEIDSSEGLFSTVNVQVNLLIAGVLSAKQLLARGVTADFVAGHSVGAFAAAVVSEVITFQEAVSLVHHRAQLMEKAFPAHYGMAALLGFTENRLIPYLKDHNSRHTPVYLSNINASDQLVVTGKIDSIAIMINKLEKEGIRKTKLLDVKVPSHCELMTSVSQSLRQQIEQLTLKSPVIPFASNVTGRLLKTADAIGKDLWQSISSPVKWYDATTLIYELGTRIFIEMEPSGVLAKLATEAFPEAEILNMDSKQIDQITVLWNNYQHK